MNWFEDIPKIFLAIVAIAAALGAAIFFMGIDFSDSDKMDETLAKTTGFVTENVVPAEFNLISRFTDKLSNHPIFLLVAVLVVLWLFGYFLPKGNQRY